MSEGLRRRHVAVVCLLVTVVFAGCASVPFLGSSCGPGSTEISSIDGNASNITVEGELTDSREGALVIDDGTGTAEILVFGDNVTSQVETGDCLVIDGTASETGESEQDVVMVTANVSVTS